jgi:sterol desaturase/sphingolipid hydroxylase (fatty acid hydroxylase superfamily)
MQDIFDSIIAILLSLSFLILVFIPLEKLFPAKKQKLLRPSFWLDVCFFLGQYLIWNGLVFWALDLLNPYLVNLMSTNIVALVQAQLWWLQAIEVVLLSDFLIYWGHRWQHHNNFLWRFHKVHHTAEHLDWLAAHREHPLDTIYTVGIINLPAIILGFPLETIAGFIAFRGIWAIYIHSNTKINIGCLKYIIGSPEMHHWHHDVERDRGNYANLSPLMDILFGTHYHTKEFPKKIGIKEKTSKNYIGQILEPLLPLKLKNKFRKE